MPNGSPGNLLALIFLTAVVHTPVGFQSVVYKKEPTKSDSIQVGGLLMTKAYKRLETKLTHSGEPDPPMEGAVSIPIFQSSTFQYAGSSR